MSDMIFEAKDAVRIDILKLAFGDHITLTDQDNEIVYRLLDEFRIGGHEYAVMLSENEDRTDDEYALFRIIRGEDNELELSTIDDDDEWEAIAELFDEMSFEP